MISIIIRTKNEEKWIYSTPSQIELFQPSENVVRVKTCVLVYR